MTKRITINNNEFVKVNNKDEVLVKVVTYLGEVFIGITKDDTPPLEKDCFLEKEGIYYNSNQYVWIKAKYPKKVDVIINN